MSENRGVVIVEATNPISVGERVEVENGFVVYMNINIILIIQSK